MDNQSNYSQLAASYQLYAVNPTQYTNGTSVNDMNNYLQSYQAYYGNYNPAQYSQYYLSQNTESKEDEDEDEEESDEEDETQPRSKRSKRFERSCNNLFNLNHILVQNILAADYFKGLYALKTYNEVIEEIKRETTNLEPLMQGQCRAPSTAFCILYKFFLMNLTIKQISKLINNQHPYIRGIGFLYIRYVCPPSELWHWLSPYLNDETLFRYFFNSISTNNNSPSVDKNVKQTIGDFVKSILEDIHYYNTLLPRIPVPIQRDIKRRILEMKQEKEMKEGDRIKCIYKKDDEYHTATIKKVLEDGNFLVKFERYDEEEEIPLSRIKTDKGLEQTVRDKERESVVAHGLAYAKKTPSCKAMISLPLTRISRKRSRSRSPVRERLEKVKSKEIRKASKKAINEIVMEQKRKLLAKYGDASNKKE